MDDARIRRRTREGQGRDTEVRKDLIRVKPQGMAWTWVQAEGNKGGSALSRERAEDTGMRCGMQGRATETGGWWVWPLPGGRRFAPGEEVERGERNERAKTMNSYICGDGIEEGGK